MEDVQNIDLAALAQSDFTPGPWEWSQICWSAIQLQSANESVQWRDMNPITTVEPCSACAERHKKEAERGNWQWGICTTVGEDDARLIALAPTLLDLAILYKRKMEKAERKLRAMEAGDD